MSSTVQARLFYGSRLTRQPDLASFQQSPAQVALEVHKLVMVGEGGVGKMALMTQFTYGRFAREVERSIDDSFLRRLVVDDVPVIVQIHKTDVNEGGLLQDREARLGEGFLLVYSITQRSTLNRIHTHHEHILRIKGPGGAGIIIVGNKCDLEAEREVSLKEGRDLAKELGCAFMETSARDRISVGEAFVDVVRQIRRLKNEVPSDRDEHQHLKDSVDRIYGVIRNPALFSFRSI
ncbi:Ras protein [Mycena sanguinolenta]|uniref:Ras protein n=1 Tax=Mycena sanguinolenta TaxID=230812 RepID=A0A8H7CVD3_9AGAR|nr:Ras protein [Mycena sanguinolenta]